MTSNPIVSFLHVPYERLQPNFRMLSKTLSKIFSVLCHYGRNLGAFNLVWNSERLSFSIPTKEGNAFKRHKICYNSIVLWGVLSFTTLIKFHFQKNIESYNLTLLFWIGGLSMTVGFSIYRWLPEDACRLMNLTLNHYRRLSGKNSNWVLCVVSCGPNHYHISFLSACNYFN